MSDRTIKSDLSNIKNELENIFLSNEIIISKRGKGYWINKDNYELISSFYIKASSQKYLPDSTSLFQDIINILLFRNNFISIEDIANKLFSNKTSINLKIDEINNKIAKYNLYILKEPRKGIKLIGSEKRQRMLFSQLLSELDSEEYVRQLQDYYPKIDVRKVQSNILEFQRKTDLYFSDISIKGLNINSVISIDRISKGNQVEISPIEISELQENIEWSYSKILTYMLSDEFNITFTDSEVSYLCIHLMGSNLKYIDESRSDLKKNQLYTNLVKALKKIDLKFGTTFEADKLFIDGLILHLRPLLIRLNYMIGMKNPWLEEIKLNYAEAFEISIFLMGLLTTEYPCLSNVEEDEIAYIAMHIGGSLERENTDYKINSLIVCPSGIGTSNLLKARLSKYFPEINITRVISVQNYKIKDVKEDLIISTIPLGNLIENKTSEKATLNISPLLTDYDKEKLQNFIKRYTNKLFFEKYTNPKLFIGDFRANNIKEVITMSSELLAVEGYVNKKYEESIFEREKISSTAIGNLLAIPHGFSDNIKKSGISIIILEKPIKWGENLVQIVFTLALKNENRNDYKNLFKEINRIYEDNEKIEQIVKCKNYEELMKIIKK